MRVPAHKDIKMIDSQGKWTGKYGVRGEKNFLDNPRAQEAALKDLTLELEKYVWTRDLNRHVGKQIRGIRKDITVSEGGLIAAMHAEGNRTVKQYFDWLKRHDWDSRTHVDDMPRELERHFKRAETRLRLFERIPYRPYPLLMQ